MDSNQIKTLIEGTVSKAVQEIVTEKMKKSSETVKSPAPFLTQRKGFGLSKMSTKPVDQLDANERGLLAGRCVRYLLANQGNVNGAVDMAKAHGDTTIVEQWEKAMASDVFASGGALIPPEFTAGIIDKLHATTVMRSLGTTVWPMNTGSITAPFISIGASASYVGQEGDNITKSQLTTGQLQLSDKKLAALVPVSNDLLRNGGTTVDNIIRNNIVREIGLIEDIAFIRYDGTAGKPRGLRYWANSANVFAANATFNAANVMGDFTDALNRLDTLNVPLDGVKIIMAPRTRWALMGLLDGNNQPVFRDEMINGTILGFPFRSTSQIPINLGGSSDESEIYFFNSDLCVIAQNESLLINAYEGGTYYDGSSMRSGISRDETTVRAITLHDFGCQQRGSEVAVITTCKWA